MKWALYSQPLDPAQTLALIFMDSQEVIRPATATHCLVGLLAGCTYYRVSSIFIANVNRTGKCVSWCQR